MKQSLYIAVVVGLQLLATFAMQLMVVRLVGINASTDAYIAAQTVPTVLSAILMAALQSVWLPRLAVIVDDAEQWIKEQAKAQGQSFIMAVGVFGLLWATHIFWQPLLFPGFTAQQIQEVGLFCGPLFLAAAFNTQSALLTVALRAKGRFLAAELIATSGSIFALISVYYTLPDWGLISVPWVTAVRAILVYAIQLWLANWPGISIKAGLQCKDTWELMRPLLFGASIYKTSPLVDRFWISQAPAGSMTAFSLAQTAINALAIIVEKIICMPVIPDLARYVSKENYNALYTIYKKNLRQITFFIIITIIAILAFNQIVVSLPKTIGINDNAATTILNIMLLFTGYLHVAISGSIAVATLYALGDTKTPTKISTYGFLLSIPMKGVFYGIYGIYGIAIANSVYHMINLFFFHYAIWHKIKNLQQLPTNINQN